MVIAESGIGSDEPRIFGFRPDGRSFTIYPHGRKVPFVKSGFRIYAPVGGMAVSDGKIYVSHRDAHDMGVVTAFDYEGNHQTVVADLPAQGDYGVTDIAVHPVNGRLFFGVGTATNSGVVGIDNWQRGWLRDHEKVHDFSDLNLKLLGRRFDTPNPFAGLFGGNDVAVTAPFQSFGVSNRTSIPGVSKPGRVGKPNGAIYSVDPGGGDLRVEAHGIHNPRGLAFNAYRLYMTNTGMELRGTRPVKDDPDVLLWVLRDTWYGWPDYSADLHKISDETYKPPEWMIIKTGYPDLSFLIDHESSGLLPPAPETLLAAQFPSLAGAAKVTFIPATASGAWGPYAEHAIVALDGDRAPFATSGQKLTGPTGYKLVRVNVSSHEVAQFVQNTKGVPGSLLNDPAVMERPIDVKLNPIDSSLYILDFGQMEMRDGREKITPRTGKIYRLVPVAAIAPEAKAADRHAPAAPGEARAESPANAANAGN